MRLPQIQLHTTRAMIGIKTNNAKVSIQQPKADLELRQPPAELNINRTPSRLTIDQSDAWESMDLKSVKKRIAEAANAGNQAVLDGIQRRASQGNDLMRIENKTNPMANQAKLNSTKKEKQFNIGFIPPHFSVKLQYEPTKLDLNWTVNKVETNVTVNKPVVDFEDGNVETSLRQRNSLSIDFINMD